MATVVVELTGDEAKLVASMRKVLEQQSKMTSEAIKTAQESKKREAEELRISKVFEGQVKSLELQTVAIEKGTAAAAEMKAIQEGLSKEQAAIIRKRHEELEATKLMVVDQQKLKNLYVEQVSKLELEAVAIKKGTAAAAEMKAIQQGLSKEQAEKIGLLTQEVELQRKNKAELESQESTTNTIVGGVESWVAGIASVSVGIGLADDALTAYILKQEKAYELAKKLAGGQQDASVNLASIESPELKQIFSEKLPDLQQRTGFADQAALLEGLGGAYSQAGDVETSLKAVEAAAKMTRQTPQALPTIAAGLAGLGTATGTTDAQANASLLLSTGKASAVTTQAGIAKNLAPVISASTMTVPKQDTQEASRETAALFAVISNQQKDFTGDPTKNQTSKFIREMGTFFDTLGEKTKEINSKIVELETKDVVTPLEKAKLDKADFDVAEKSTAAKRLAGRGGPQEAEAVIALAEATARRDEMRVSSTLSKEERTQLAELKTSQASLAPIRDPGTIAGRLSVLQTNDAAKEIVTKNLGNDEATGSYRALLNVNSDLAKKYKEAASEITFSPKLFQDNATKLETLTPELRVGTAASRVNAAAEVATMKDTTGATRAAILDLEKTAMQQTAVSSMSAIQNSFRYGAPLSMIGISSSARSTASAMETDKLLAEGSIDALTQRREAVIANQSPGASRDANIQLLTTAIEEIKRLADSNAQAVATEKQNELMADQNKLLAQVVANTGKNQATPANPAAPAGYAIRAQANQRVIVGAQ